MLRLGITLNLLLLFCSPAQSQSTGKPRKILEFCTTVGPVELTIEGDSVKGRYLLTVTPDRKQGIIKGTISKGLIQGTWDDPDGIGRIIIGFNPGSTKFIAIYNTAKEASHWYNEWKGISKATINSVSAEERKYQSCDWKK